MRDLFPAGRLSWLAAAATLLIIGLAAGMWLAGPSEDAPLSGPGAVATEPALLPVSVTESNRMTDPELVDAVVQSVVTIVVEPGWQAQLGRAESSASTGSGVILTPQGHVVTNYHVVMDAGRAGALLADSRVREAHLVGVDPLTDLAVLQIRPDASLRPIPLADSDSVRAGDRVFAVGSPNGLASTTTQGMVSAVGRDLSYIQDAFGLPGVEDFIQTDAPINLGNSGGALVNENGALIGINTANAYGMDGLGFAIPINLVTRVVEDILDYGEVRRPYSGLTYTESVPLRHSDYGRQSQRYEWGVRVENVYHRAADGLREGDVIVAVENRPMTAPNRLRSTMYRSRPGQALTIAYLRNGSVHMAELALLGEDHPDVARFLEESIGYAPRHSTRFLAAWDVVIRELMGADGLHDDREGLMVEEGAQVRPVGTFSDGLLVKEINEVSVQSVQDAVALLRDTRREAILTVVDPWQEEHEIVLPAPYQ